MSTKQAAGCKVLTTVTGTLLVILLGIVIHSIQQILTTYYVQSLDLGTGGTAMKPTGENPCPWETLSN